MTDVGKELCLELIKLLCLLIELLKLSMCIFQLLFAFFRCSGIHDQDTYLGNKGGRVIAVDSDAMAVISLTVPDNQYVAYQRVQTSRKWVTPHAMIKPPKATKIQRNGRSW